MSQALEEPSVASSWIPLRTIIYEQRKCSYQGRSWIRFGASASSAEPFLYTKKSAEVIVVKGNEPQQILWMVSQINEGLNVEQLDYHKSHDKIYGWSIPKMRQRFCEKGQGTVGEKSFCIVWRTAVYETRLVYPERKSKGTVVLRQSSAELWEVHQWAY